MAGRCRMSQPCALMLHLGVSADRVVTVDVLRCSTRLSYPPKWSGDLDLNQEPTAPNAITDVSWICRCLCVVVGGAGVTTLAGSTTRAGCTPTPLVRQPGLEPAQWPRNPLATNVAQVWSPVRPGSSPRSGSRLITCFSSCTHHSGHRQGWKRGDSNSRHPACKTGALPAELRPHVDVRRATLEGVVKAH